MGVSVREIALKEGGVSFSIDIYFKGQRQQVKTDIQAGRSEGREYKKARQQAEARAAELAAQLKIDPCVQRRLEYSAGNRPAGVRVRSPVTWIAGWRETKNPEAYRQSLRKGDCECAGRNESERTGDLENSKS